MITPMMQQYLDVKAQYPDAILFYRLGDFYEMFYEDAKIASKELELTLTGRDCGEPERAPMCGIPFHAAEGYIGRLINRGYKVVICEQMEDPALAKGLVKREVVRIVTPGTVTDSSMLREGCNNYLCAVFAGDSVVAVCFADISTGEASVTHFEGAARLSRLQNELGTYAPREIIWNGSLDAEPELKAYCIQTLHAVVSEMQTSRFERTQAENLILRQFKKTPAELGLDAEGMCEAVGALLNYTEETQKCDTSYVKELNVYADGQYMELDLNTRRNLELCETMRTKEKRGTLLWVLDRTKSAMGARLLRKWVELPLVNLHQILMRQAAVTELFSDFDLREELQTHLRDVLDLERLMTRVMYGSANAKDLRAIAQTLVVLKPIKSLLANTHQPQMLALYEEMDDLADVYTEIDRTLVEKPPFSLREGGFIREGFDETVDRLHEIIHNSKGFLEKMEAEEREKTGIKNLKIGYNRVFGYYIEVTKSNLADVPAYYVRKQTLTGSERYITDQLKQMESTILGASDKIASLEYELFQRLRERVAAEVKRIQQSAEALAKLDVYLSLACVAQQYHYTCPEVDCGDIITIKDGRHPVVEQFVEKTGFVPNDTLLDTNHNRLALITGPNMAGKSTYMRQTALIVLMAQIGSYIPAKEARIGIVDKLFTRVGASDDLASGQSTFMLEMNEVAYILKHATKRSLIIYDEIGRGTSTFDGMSIAQAVAEYTAGKRLGAKTLFATHYHELTALAEQTDGIVNYHIAARKKGDDITFLRKIVRGAADDSYGIEVAKLAGVPNEVIKRAKMILEKLESDSAAYRKQQTASEISEEMTITFDTIAEREVARKIRDLDPNLLTPMDALQLIQSWKKDLN